MAVAAGKSGELRIGGETIATLREWSLERTADPIEHTVMAEWRDYAHAPKGWSCQIEGFSDAAQFALLQIQLGDIVELTLFPAGTAIAEKRYDGTALVTAYTETGAFDGMVEFSATLTGKGAITTTTV